MEQNSAAATAKPPASYTHFIRALAGVLIHTPSPARQESLDALLGRRWQWTSRLLMRFERAFPDDGSRTRPREREVFRHLMADHPLREAYQRHEAKIRLTAVWMPAGEATMKPVEAASNWPIPSITTAGELAQWLSLQIPELDWFANLKPLGGSQQLQHYRYQVLQKRQGNAALRLIESPKPRLKVLQRGILEEILNAIPVHDAAHGFVRSRSIRTFAEPHTDRRVVLKMDLKDFFPSIPGARIQSFFRTAGYPETVADLLGGLCTNRVPKEVWTSWPDSADASRLYDLRHLPQGAPTSPALANRIAYQLDCRLTGLASACGATYTRYADDLAFSSDSPEFERSIERFATYAAFIAADEGFQVHHRKTRIMRQGVRQHLAGLVVNRRLNIRRHDYDELKAILTNCIRSGPASQNRGGLVTFREHLEGRVGYVESVHSEKGEKLRSLLSDIDWA